MAFGLTNYDGSSDIVEDPDYATVIGAYRIWGFDDILLETIEIPSQFCTRDDFGLDYYQVDEDERKKYPKPAFFEPYEDAVGWLEVYHPMMRCLTEPIDIYGNNQSKNAQLFTVEVVPCNPKKRSTCKSKEEIDEWLTGKWVIVQENSDSFFTDQYGVKRV